VGLVVAVCLYACAWLLQDFESAARLDLNESLRLASIW
jgi:hypothetical protein